jgi:hypothetical protein
MICHQFPPGSLPVISILVLAGIIPNTVLAVEGSRRTLTWSDVTPSTGGTVGGGEGGIGESNPAGVVPAGDVEVMSTEVGAAVISPWTARAQLVLKIKIKMAILANRRDTTGF